MAVLLLTLAQDVGAKSPTGDQLLGMCAPEALPSLYMYCLGYLDGAADTLHKLAVSGATSIPLACPPEGVTPKQLALILVQYLEYHPEKLHLSGSELALLALRNVFPCK